jgi:hypothetical protein
MLEMAAPSVFCAAKWLPTSKSDYSGNFKNGLALFCVGIFFIFMIVILSSIYKHFLSIYSAQEAKRGP